MRTATVFLFSVMLVTLAAVPSALADPPINGVYQTTDLGGSMLTGRYSESWTMASGRLELGNTTNKLSWDGATLGTQWWMYCSEIAAPPILILDTLDGNGNGQQQWLVMYTGGVMILDGNGPWGNGSEPSYTAIMDSYTETKLFMYDNFQVVNEVASISIQATFVGFNNMCVSLSIGNQEEHSNTDHMMPIAYPGFLAPGTCAPTRTRGSYGEVDDFTLIIMGCALPTEVSSWGAIKALYK
jgi:hypothetical protein